LGVLTKLYPAVLVPVLVAAWLAPVDRRRLVRFGAGLVVTVVLGMLPLVLLAGDAVWSFIAYHRDRGLHIETVPGGMLLLSLETRFPAQLVVESYGVVGPLATAYLRIQPWLTVGGFAALATLAVMRCRADVRTSGSVVAGSVVRLAAASVLLFCVTNKVFSIQYVVWLIPFAALLSRGQFWLAAAAAALSVWIHPLFYMQLVDQATFAVILLNVRNGLIVALLVWLVADLLRGLRPDRARLAGTAADGA